VILGTELQVAILRSLFVRASITVIEEGGALLKIRSSQKVFTEEEVSSLTGIGVEHLRALAGNRHLGFVIDAAQYAGSSALGAAQAAGAQALEAAQRAGTHAQRLFTATDLYILTALLPRCEH
jgi:hypothetical protein